VGKRLSFAQRRDCVSFADFLPFVGLCSGDIAIDCGANIGHITNKMALTGAKVYAFEPNPYAYRLLEKRFAKFPNVTCINKGVWDRNSKVRLYLHEKADEDQVKWSTGSSLLSYKRNVNSKTSVGVEVIDLVQFIRDLNAHIALIKIDVEGVECAIINKLIDSGVIKVIQHCLVETHERGIPELKKDIGKLKKRIEVEKLTNINLKYI